MESLEEAAYSVAYKSADVSTTGVATNNVSAKLEQAFAAENRLNAKQSIERRSIRKTIFLNLDGIAMASTMNALLARGVFSLFEVGKSVALGTVLQQFPGNIGYLNVALRLMVSQGWMKRQEADGQFQYALTPKGSVAVKLAPAYAKPVTLIPMLIQMDRYLFEKQNASMFHYESLFSDLIQQAQRQWDLPESSDEVYQSVRSQLLHHLNGLLVGPVMVSLAMAGVFDQFEGDRFLDIKQIDGNLDHLTQAFELLALQGWAMKQGDQVRLTDSGAYAASRAYAYGVTVSYLPTFARVPDLLFGDPNVLWELDTNGHETHVNRRANVWGSGQAHKTYFKQVDSIIIDIFNRPIEQQPKGIVDMGCGDGTFMEHLYHVVRDKTERGKVLDEYPLLMVCADYHRTPREVTENRLKNLTDTCSVVFGDINDPDSFAEDLAIEHQINSKDFLHVRSFLDHNRPFIEPMMSEIGCELKSTGAYACRGKLIQSEELLRNLVEHFNRWARNIGPFGLLVLDLHTIPPELAAENVGYTLATAYDATHGYTDQYPIELSQFIAAAATAGLAPDLRYQAKFPPSELATISLNLFLPISDHFG